MPEALLRQERCHAAAACSASQRNQGVALLSLLTTMLHTGVPGALLALSPRAWYATYGRSTLALGTPLHDQHLGDLLMWVPTAIA